MRLFQAALDTPLGSPFSATRSAVVRAEFSRDAMLIIFAIVSVETLPVSSRVLRDPHILSGL